MKKILIGIFTMVVLTANAQEFEDIIAAGKGDASIYLGNYLQPLYKGLIYDLNSGWYHTGKTHKKYGFDITISANASFVPQADKVFRFNNADYTALELQSGLSSDDLPSVMGVKSTKRISVKIPVNALGEILPPGTPVPPGGSIKVASFETLDGIEEDLPVAAVPSAMVQFGIGLPSKTDLKLRFVPKIDASEDTSFQLFGIGLQHDLLQHFKSKKNTPLSLSILGAYTTATTVYAPKDSNIGVNQITTIKIDAYTAQLIGDYNLKIINFYAALGYTAGSTSTIVEGDYKYTYNIEGTNKTVTIHDPININYSLSGVKATLGMRINIAFFKIFADYSLQEYNTASAGISFSFK